MLWSWMVSGFNKTAPLDTLLMKQIRLLQMDQSIILLAGVIWHP